MMDKDHREKVVSLARTFAKENVEGLRQQKQQKQKKWLLPIAMLVMLAIAVAFGKFTYHPQATQAQAVAAKTSAGAIPKETRQTTPAQPAAPSATELLQNFSGMAVKRLSATDIDPHTSHQHEITGVVALQELFGTTDQRLRGRLLYYGSEVFSTDVDLTWYNAARTGNPRWRLYYRDNPVIDKSKPGDTMVVALYGKDRALVIVTPENSKYQDEIASLLKLKGAAQIADDAGKENAKEAITTQLQQTGRVPVNVSIYRDIDDPKEMTVEGTVEKVKDGDTIQIGGVFDIRLLGIDAPEHNQTCEVNGQVWACGKEATDYLTSLVQGKKVSCINRKKEKYGRLLSVCKVDGIDINQKMIEKGLAIIYYTDDYAEAEKKARLAGVGLWNSKFINPADFRHHTDAAQP